MEKKLISSKREFSNIGKIIKSKVDKSKIQNVQFINSNIEINFIDYYFTNHIARSSMTMNECRSIKKKLMSTELKG